ncbi:MAG: hypothetical protein U0401_14760 [Anaerolineae bacterium]
MDRFDFYNVLVKQRRCGNLTCRPSQRSRPKRGHWGTSTQAAAPTEAAAQPTEAAAQAPADAGKKVLRVTFSWPNRIDPRRGRRLCQLYAG